MKNIDWKLVGLGSVFVVVGTVLYFSGDDMILRQVGVDRFSFYVATVALVLIYFTIIFAFKRWFR